MITPVKTQKQTNTRKKTIAVCPGTKTDPRKQKKYCKEQKRTKPKKRRKPKINEQLEDFNKN